jgi:hypothetical protein
MINETAKLFNRASISVRPEDVLLKKGSWVKFSNQFPNQSNFAWASGRSFEVAADPVLVKFPVALKLPGSDYQLLDLSNQTVPSMTSPPGISGTLQAYPAQTGILYEIALGLHKGNYIVQLYVPKGQFVYTVGSTTIFPDLANQYYRYLGAKRAQDSPERSPLWKLYAIYSQPAFILAPYVDGVDFDKVTIDLYINKCPLREVLAKSQMAQAAALAPTQTPLGAVIPSIPTGAKVFDDSKWEQMQDKATLIEWYTEMQSF